MAPSRRSRVASLPAELAYVAEFLDSRLHAGKEGYALVSLQCACRVALERGDGYAGSDEVGVGSRLLAAFTSQSEEEVAAEADTVRPLFKVRTAYFQRSGGP